MHISQLDYDLPAHLIAQHPSERRDQSRLLVLQRSGRVLGHHHFADLPLFLRAGDLLVLNDTRVLPARLYGRRADTGGKWEGLFLRETPDGRWEMLGQTRGRLRTGETVVIEAQSDQLTLSLEDRTAEGHFLFRPLPAGSAVELLGRFGQPPLPPYIRKGRAEAGDVERYQTVFAQRPGAVAAPTAGLHFTQELFARLRQQGVNWATVTLHVGPGTFQPIQVEDVTQHQVHSEWCELPAVTVEAIRACKNSGGRVYAVGTTSVRTLETVAARGELREWAGETELTIRPPFTFRVVDGLITNFHLPRSSLLLLVAAFAGWESLRESYRVAVAQEYRFYSYGDAMLIVPDHEATHP